MSIVKKILKLIPTNEQEKEKIDDSDLRADVIEKLKLAASRMVDNIEDRREAGNYSKESRTSLEQAFYNNMVKMIKGEISRENGKK